MSILIEIFTAPSGQSFTPNEPNFGEYSGPLPNGNDIVIMTGLQIAMSRELFGWPLYTIVIALGQVSSCIHLFTVTVANSRF